MEVVNINSYVTLHIWDGVFRFAPTDEYGGKLIQDTSMFIRKEVNNTTCDYIKYKLIKEALK